jgi:hypothetical protein
MFFALLPFLFIFKMQKRERAWLITVGAIYPFLGVLLAIFLNPSRERQTADLVKVFFIASHAVVAILIGYGLALTAAFMATNYQKFRRWGFVGAGIAVALSLYALVALTGEHYFGLDGQIPPGDLPHWIAQSFAPDQYGLPVIAALMLVAMTVIFARSAGDYIGAFCRASPLRGNDALVQQRAAQSLVRLLVRARHVHAAVRRAG